MLSSKSLLVSVLCALLVRAAPSATTEEDAAAAAGPTQVASYKTWKTAQGGCWEDHNKDRALDHFLGNINGNLTVQTCLDACEAHGFFLAGVEFGQECSCGNTIIDRNGPTQASKCNTACVGNSKQLCGGANAMNLYVRNNYKFTTGPAELSLFYKNYIIRRCEKDSATARTLKFKPRKEIPQDEMTIQKCIDGCDAAGYSSAGVTFGRECTCETNPRLPLLPQTLSDCSSPCLADGSTYCGGVDRVLIYTSLGRF